jgi:hypothetical protein
MLGQTLEMLDRGADAIQAYDRGIAAAVGAGNDHALSELRQARDAVAAREG